MDLIKRCGTWMNPNKFENLIKVGQWMMMMMMTRKWGDPLVGEVGGGAMDEHKRNIEKWMNTWMDERGSDRLDGVWIGMNPIKLDKMRH